MMPLTRRTIGLAAISVALTLTMICCVARCARSSHEKPAATADVIETTVRGRLYCSLKRPVFFPFHGVITEVKAQNGQRVKGGDVLLRYKLTVETIAQLHRRVSPDAVDDLRATLLDLRKQKEMIENQRREATKLEELNLSSPGKLKQINQDLELMKIRVDSSEKRLSREEKLLADDLRLLKDLTGEDISSLHVPEVVSLLAPLDSYILQINPAIRKDGETVHDSAAFTFGLMDPMILRCQVHEQDAVRIALDDPAVVVFESVRGRRFIARVSRISWLPLTDSMEQPSYYEIELTVPNRDAVLKEGFQGEVVFKKKNSN